MSATTDWQNLVTAALLGTERRPPPMPGGPIGGLLASDEAVAPEQALLDAAAALAQYRRAGYTATIDSGQAPEFAPAEVLQPCGRRAARQFGQILNGHHRELLPEWLEHAVAAGRRVPAAHLPALLDLGRSQQAIRPQILATIGERGRWLAAQNSEWAYAAPTPQAETAAWETADRATRLTTVAALRESQPDIARQLIQATWPSEKADDRSALLHTLETGLAMADEPFLEAALDDRSKEVRHVAADLLTRLPQSRLAMRMRERATGYLAFKRRLLRAAVIELRLPDACDAAMQRDGIESKAHGSRGEKAWWLHQILLAIAPNFWSQHWNATPTEILASAAQSEWKELLLNAWLAATTRHHDADWAEALLVSNLLPVGAEVETLLAALPNDRRERFVAKLLREDSPLAPAMLRQCTHSWSQPFARTAVAWFRAQARAARQPNWLVLTIVKESARYLPPTLAAECAEGWPTEAPYWQSWQGAVDRLLVVLQFRADMHAALRPLNPAREGSESV